MTKIDPAELEQLKINRDRLKAKLKGFKEGSTEHTRTSAQLLEVEKELAKHAGANLDH